MQHLSYLIQRSSDANNLLLTEHSTQCFKRRQKHLEIVIVFKKTTNPQNKQKTTTDSWEEEEQTCKSILQWRKAPTSHHTHLCIYCIRHWLTLTPWGLGAVWRNRCATWPQQKGSSNQWLLETTETVKAGLVAAEALSVPFLCMTMREAKENRKAFLIILVMTPVEGLQWHTWG